MVSRRPLATFTKNRGFTPTPERKLASQGPVKNLRLVWGFTVLELLIVMGIAAIILALGIPISWNFYLDYELVYEQRTLNSLLGYARNLSMVNTNEAVHGLYIDDSNFVVFEGDSYAARDINADKPFPRSGAITIAGPSEQRFLQLSGQTSSSTYSVSNGRKTFTTYVNSEGRIEW